MDTSENELGAKKIFQNYSQQSKEYKKDESKKITMVLNQSNNLSGGTPTCFTDLEPVI